VIIRDKIRDLISDISCYDTSTSSAKNNKKRKKQSSD
jgi:hypothetical protein